jgi:hypothetical protein
VRFAGRRLLRPAAETPSAAGGSATILAPYRDRSANYGDVALFALRAEAPPDWAPLLAAACAADDEHAIKSTYTAWRLDRALDDAVSRTAAARYLTLTTTR